MSEDKNKKNNEEEKKTIKQPKPIDEKDLKEVDGGARFSPKVLR